jgi:hypothetical protein
MELELHMSTLDKYHYDMTGLAREELNLQYRAECEGSYDTHGSQEIHNVVRIKMLRYCAHFHHIHVFYE